MTKEYFGTKRIKAQPMNRLEYSHYRGWQLPANERPLDGGYLVEYIDGGPANDDRHTGYITWSPKAVFDGSYQPDGRLSFGHAIVALKAGHKVARAGWNGKGMFIYLVPAASYPVQTSAAKSHFGEGSMVPYNAYMAIKNVNETVSTWVPSVNDCLSDDWHIVP